MSIVDWKSKMTHSDCDKIIGRPTFETIKTLENQIISNCTVTNTPLGGGNFRFLGLVKSPAAYALLSPIPFVRPPPPPPLVIPLGADAAAIRVATEQHAQACKTWADCDEIERVLKKQIMNAIDKQYIKAIIHNTTQDIQLQVHEIFKHLYNAYGQVTAQKCPQIYF